MAGSKKLAVLLRRATGETGEPAMRSGYSLEQLQRLSAQEKDALYALGHSHYGQNHYVEALRIFTLLTLADFTDVRFHNAVGASSHMLGHYKEAVIAYGLAFSLNFENVTPLFHIGQCLVALNKIEDARDMLETFVSGSANAPENEALRLRALVLLESLPT